MKTTLISAALTLTAGFGPVPLGPLAVPHDAGERGVSLQQVPRLAVESHHGAQLVVAADPGAVHHVARIKTRLPQFSCEREQNKEFRTYNNYPKK